MGHCTFWISFCWDQRLRQNGSSSVSVWSWDLPISTAHITAHSLTPSLTSSLISPYLSFYLQLAKKWSNFCSSNVISNWLIYLVYAKSTGELISFGFSNCSVRSLDSANRKSKNDFTFWLIFGLSPNLGLSESLSERLIQKVKWPAVQSTSATAHWLSI